MGIKNQHNWTRTQWTVDKDSLLVCLLLECSYLTGIFLLKLSQEVVFTHHLATTVSGTQPPDQQQQGEAQTTHMQYRRLQNVCKKKVLLLECQCGCNTRRTALIILQPTFHNIWKVRLCLQPYLPYMEGKADSKICCKHSAISCIHQ